MRLFPAADGSNVRFTTIAEDGAAAGAKFLADARLAPFTSTSSA